ncbi:transcriptional repressor [Kineococcus aurantiacus]|uniref:Fur family ferric uptake transcriptional regulator n=1 Tax=Kineococcus aurantiacus TaxID=37633 RepID=A0A7Y9ATW8_9ACTN|nr:Fur family ferric uptake transcriptional regulator [Kineococcus aurantiacus]
MPSTDLPALLHARGLRSTPQRRRILDAVRDLGHASAEEVSEHLAPRDGSPGVDPSTVYRALAVLEEVGLVARTQLDRKVPSFHAVEHGGHLHLVCDGCGAVAEAAPGPAREMAAEILSRDDFVVDTGHLALRGRCARCRDR